MISLSWEVLRLVDAAIPATLEPTLRAQLPADTVAFFEGLTAVLARDGADHDAVARGLIVLGQLGNRLGPGLIPSSVVVFALYRDWLRYLRYVARADAATRAAVDAEVAEQLAEVDTLATLSDAVPQGRA